MKLYLLEQDDHEGYDTFSAIIVAAPSVMAAIQIPPRSSDDFGKCWANSPESVTFTCLGTAEPSIKQGVILTSFHRG
jgi:hypothetical protein